MVGHIGSELQRRLTLGDEAGLEIDVAKLIQDWQKEWPYLICRDLRGGGFVIGTLGMDGQIGTDDVYFEYWPVDRDCGNSGH